MGPERPDTMKTEFLIELNRGLHRRESVGSEGYISQASGSVDECADEGSAKFPSPIIGANVNPSDLSDPGFQFSKGPTGDNLVSFVPEKDFPPGGSVGSRQFGDESIDKRESVHDPRPRLGVRVRVVREPLAVFKEQPSDCSKIGRPTRRPNLGPRRFDEILPIRFAQTAPGRECPSGPYGLQCYPSAFSTCPDHLSD